MFGPRLPPIVSRKYWPPKPKVPEPPLSEFIDLEPFSRLPINKNIQKLYRHLWKRIARSSLQYYHYNDMYKDIWETITWGYHTVEDMYEAYYDLCNFLYENDFDDYYTRENLQILTRFLWMEIQRKNPNRPKRPQYDELDALRQYRLKEGYDPLD